MMAINALITSLLVIATAKVALATYDTIYCYPPTAPAYGGYLPKNEQYGIGYAIEYHCDDGYKLIGKAIAKCIYDDVQQIAIFSPSPPICEREFIVH